MRALAGPFVAACAAIAGCGQSGGEPGLGQPCTVLCSTGLSCSSLHFCVKTCQCDASALCADTTLATGCPLEAECVAVEAAGGGMCASLCGPSGPDAGCPPGEGACATAPDGTPICVGPAYRWLFTDAGTD
jgi:hypothetical protein